MINYNGTAVNKITYNSTSLKRVDYNGVTVWEKLEPPTISLSGTYMSITKAANSTKTIMYCFNSNDTTTPISWATTGGTGYNISAWITDPGNYIIKAIAVGPGSLNGSGVYTPSGIYANSEWSNSQPYTVSDGYAINWTFEDGGWIYDAGFMIEDSNGNELGTENNPIISPTQQVTLKIIRVRGQYDVNELIINTATLNGNDISFTKIPRDDSYPPDDYRMAGYYTATLTLSKSNILIIDVDSHD